MNARLNLSFKPIKDKIEDAGRRAARFLTGQGLSEDAVRVQMEILRELIANARALDRGRPSGRSLSLKMEVGENAVIMEVSLRVDESDRPQIEALEKTVQLLRGAQSPFEAFIAQRRQPNERPDELEPIGAGLARIAYEDRALVDFFIDQDQALTLSAVGPYPPGERRRRRPAAPASETIAGQAY
jgi:hypothetical protein